MQLVPAMSLIACSMVAHSALQYVAHGAAGYDCIHNAAEGQHAMSAARVYVSVKCFEILDLYISCFGFIEPGIIRDFYKMCWSTL